MTSLPLVDRPGDATLAHADTQAITVATFLRHVGNTAVRLPADGRYAINLCENRYAFTVGFAAVIVAGQTNLLPANRLPSTIAEVSERYPGAYLLSDADIDLAVADEPPDRESVPAIDPGHVAAIAFTSGSTGQSKPIVKSWRTLYEGARINAAEMGLVGGETRHLVATVPAQHMYGLETSVLVPWVAPVAADGRRPFTPRDVADCLAAVPAPRVLVSTPVHLQTLHDPGLSLPPMERIFSATAPLDPGLARALESRRATRVSEIYGCSETGSLARRRPGHEEAWTLYRGFALDLQGQRATITAAHLCGPVELQDRIEALGGRTFRLLGRMEDLVNIAGKRASLADLNQRLLRVEGVRDGVIFEPPTTGRGPAARLAALVVAPGLDAESVRRRLRHLVDEAFLPRPIRMVDALPRAETGKLTRKAVLALFEEGRQQHGRSRSGALEAAAGDDGEPGDRTV